MAKTLDRDALTRWASLMQRWDLAYRAHESFSKRAAALGPGSDRTAFQNKAEDALTELADIKREINRLIAETGLKRGAIKETWVEAELELPSKAAEPGATEIGTPHPRTEIE